MPTPWYRRKLGNLGRLAVVIVLVAIVVDLFVAGDAALVLRGALLTSALVIFVIAFLRAPRESP